VLAIASGKGGVGKSTLSVNLAAAFDRSASARDPRRGRLRALDPAHARRHAAAGRRRQDDRAAGAGDLKLMSIGFFLERTRRSCGAARCCTARSSSSSRRALGRAGHARRRHAAGTGDVSISLGQLLRAPRSSSSRRRSRGAAGRRARGSDGAEDRHAPDRSAREHVVSRRQRRGALRLGRRGRARRGDRRPAPRQDPARSTSARAGRPGRAARMGRAGERDRAGDLRGAEAIAEAAREPAPSRSRSRSQRKNTKGARRRPRVPDRAVSSSRRGRAERSCPGATGVLAPSSPDRVLPITVADQLPSSRAHGART
jgi:hypothetical protein